jgi:hypothetical protein
LAWESVCFSASCYVFSPFFPICECISHVFGLIKIALIGNAFGLHALVAKEEEQNNGLFTHFHFCLLFRCSDTYILINTQRETDALLSQRINFAISSVVYIDRFFLLICRELFISQYASQNSGEKANVDTSYGSLHLCSDGRRQQRFRRLRTLLHGLRKHWYLSQSPPEHVPG